MKINELAEQVQNHFGRIEVRIDTLETKFDTQMDIFEGTILSAFHLMREEMAESMAKYSIGTQEHIDAVMAELRDHRQEFKALTNRVDRHEEWIGELAEHGGTRLTHWSG